MDPVLGSLLGNLGSTLLGGVFGGKSSGADRRFAQHIKDQGMSEMLGWADNHRVKVLGHSVDQINRDRDLAQSGKAMQQSFDVGAANGLTPQEIAGSPVPGGTSVSGSNTLGNSHTAQTTAMIQAADRAADRDNAVKIEGMRNKTQLATAAMQQGVNLLGQKTERRGQDMQMSRAELQSETQKYVSELSANASITSSSIMAQASKYASDMAAQASMYSSDTSRANVLGQLKLAGKVNDAQIAQMSAQTALLLQDKDIKNALHDERWAKLFSTMGAENVIASALAMKHGLPLEDVLKGQNPQPHTLRAIDAFATDVLSRSSVYRRETIGAGSIFKDTILDPILGR